MKFTVLLAVPSTALAASWTNLFQGMTLEKGGKSSVSAEDMSGCVAHASKFITGPVGKLGALEAAMDSCATSKKVDDNNFVCPHYLEMLNAAFKREPTDKTYTAKSFCEVAETYVSQLSLAANVPNMGHGEGFNFKLSKECIPIVEASISPAKHLPSKSAPDFWYALCMNQDCAHFLPSRTRWCTDNHGPTHSAAVCEAVRGFAADEIAVLEGGSMKPDDVCDMYADFVKDNWIMVDAYNHCVHGKKHTKVPVPEDKKRALGSTVMKNEAEKHVLRDAQGDPVKSAAPMMAAGLLLPLVGLVAL